MNFENVIIENLGKKDIALTQLDVFWCIYHKIDLFEHNLFENDFLKSNIGSSTIESNEKCEF